MRARTLRIFFCISVAALCIKPLAVYAFSEPYVVEAGFDMLPRINIGPGQYQSAFKTGDTEGFKLRIESRYGVPIVSADLSQLGVASPTTTPVYPTGAIPMYINGVDYPYVYFFHFASSIIGPDIPDGVKTVSVTATDPRGSVATTSMQIIIDTIPPTLTLSDISFSSAPPQKGTTMYLSGVGDGTGSPLTIYEIKERIFDKDGHQLFISGLGYGYINYDRTRLTAAIAASPDGSFTRVPFTLDDFPTNPTPTAASMQIEITAYDGGGHILTTSLTVPVPQPPPPDPCIAAGNCASNVLFLPGIEGSRLYEGAGCGKTAEEKLWEPYDSFTGIVRGAGDSKVRDLGLTPAGESACSDIYAKSNDVLDSVRSGNIYQSFITEMNGLKADGTIIDWRPVAYDWRLSFGDLLTKGAERGGKIYYAGGDTSATSTPYIEQTLRALAASSKTGKVTIVAHSNGGLLAKALLNKLGNETSTLLVDKIIMVGVPQSGAPAALGALLYGYGQDITYRLAPIGGTPIAWVSIVHADAARELAKNSPMAYHLLPSEDYFESTMSDTAHPVARFAGKAYARETAAYGATIANRAALSDFLTASALNTSLVAYANAQHAALDSWIPPAGIEVSQIAGWGVDTLAGVDFYTPPPTSVLSALEPVRAYRPIPTEDGDGTVPVPSALQMASSTNVKRYWVDLAKINNVPGARNKYSHKDILETPSLEDFIKNIVKNSTSTLPFYIVSTQPPSTSNKKLTFFLHSPLTLQLTDSLGNVTGLAEDGLVTESISGSSYGEFGEVKYVTVPEGSAYTLTMHGLSSGTFSLDMQETSGSSVTAVSTIANVPTTASTLASLTVSGGLDTASSLIVDENGDGKSMITMSPKVGETVNYEPPTPPAAPAPRAAPAGSISIPIISPIVSPVIAVTAPVLATTTQVVTMGTLAVIKPIKPLQAQQKLPIVKMTKMRTDATQTASVYNAVSQQSVLKSVGAAVYNGWYGFWAALKRLF